MRFPHCAILALSLILLLCGCSESGQPSHLTIDQAVVHEVTPKIVLGVNDHYENYCFGAISDVEFLSDGKIAVLDRFYGGARVYSPSGEFLYNIGVAGEGPGEFGSPSSIACRGDRVVIIDQIAYKATLFDASGRYLSELRTSFAQTPPSFVSFVCESLIVGGVTTMDTSNGVYEMNYMVVVLDMEFNPVDTLFSNPFTYEVGNVTQMLQNSLFACSYTTDGMGRIFVAEASTEEYRIEGIDLTEYGTYSITREIQPVAKTQDEISRESERFTRLIQARNPGVHHEYVPLAMKYLIPPSGIHADGLGRLWVLRGYSDQLTFDTYDYSGELLFSTVVHGIPVEEPQEVLWWSVSRHGISVFSRDPYEKPLVWIFDLPA